MTGRSYDTFYAQRGAAKSQMERLKGENSYSKQEALAIIEAATLYEKTSDVLSNLHTQQQTQPLSEALRERTFRLLIKIDNTGDIRAVRSEVESLNKAVFAEAVKAGVPRKRGKPPEGFEKVTKKSINHLLKVRRERLKSSGNGFKLEAR